MSALPTNLIAQIARLAISYPQLAINLLPASVRPAVYAMQNLPDLREQLTAQWTQLNNAIESDWSGATAAQRASLEARMRQKRAHLDAATAAMARVDTVLVTATTFMRSLGLPIPTYPLLPRGLNGPIAIVAGAAATGLIIIAAAYGGGLIISALSDASREVAAAGRVALGLDPAPPAQPGSGGIVASLGTSALLIAGVVAFALMRKGGR